MKVTTKETPKMELTPKKSRVKVSEKRQAKVMAFGESSSNSLEEADDFVA